MNLSHAQSTRLRPPRPLSQPRVGGIGAACAAAVAAAAIGLGVHTMGHNPQTAQNAPVAAVASPSYAPREVVISYAHGMSAGQAMREVHQATGLNVTRSGAQAGAPDSLVALLPKGAAMTVPQAAKRIAEAPGISYAVPNYIAHAAGDWIPNDPGRGTSPGGWQQVQWNFGADSGIDAPGAWANLRADGRPGAKGVVIAVVDTGVAFTDWDKYTRSPDFDNTHFTSPCDLIAGKYVNGKCTDPYPLDREGHGTFVASVLAESTNNGIGLAGLAYGATIIPIRVLNASGNGTATAIAAGIRYAVAKRARIINLSMEFSLSVKSKQIPEILSAITDAHNHGDVVVAAAGNDYARKLAYPARATGVISVGATTKDRCVANYSDTDDGLDIVAPGGGDDATGAPGSCHPDRMLPDVYQMTFDDPEKPTQFSLPDGWYGTSMAAPDVSAAAAMVIASGVIGRNPSPDNVLRQLEQTATPLGGTVPNRYYGYGLLNLAAATTTGAPPSTTTTTTPLTGTGTTTTPGSGGAKPTPPSSNPEATPSPTRTAPAPSATQPPTAVGATN